MGSISTEVDICNSALLKVGRDLISSLDDDNERARVVKNRYALVRDELLTSHPWNFALPSLQLAVTLNTPIFDYSKEFQLPDDVLRILKTDLSEVPPSSDKRVTTTFGFDLPAWKIEGDKLLANDGTVRILYIKRITDTSKFSSTFAEALALRLALDIAYRMTNDLNLVESLKQSYQVQLSLARSYDAQESDADNIATNDWLNSRL